MKKVGGFNKTESGLQIDHMENLVQAFMRAPQNLLITVRKELEAAADEVLETAKSRAPFESGELENSTFKRIENDSRRGFTIEFGFDGNAIPYLLQQHEDLDYQHPGQSSKTHDRGRAEQGQAKFLESAIHDKREVIRAALKRAMMTGVSSGRGKK